MKRNHTEKHDYERMLLILYPGKYVMKCVNPVGVMSNDLLNLFILWDLISKVPLI